MRSRGLAVTIVLAFAAQLALAPAVSLYAQAAGYAEAPAPTKYAEAIDFARLVVNSILDGSGTPGVSVAVGIDGQIVWSEGFGYADVEHRVPVWEETKFRIGSVSKPLTAAAVALLIEQGKLDLDAPVQSYVPDFPEKRWPITTRQLAGHLAGVRHYRGDEFLNKTHYTTVTEGLEIFKNDTLLFEPGTRYSYSSYAWNLISAVVEGASGESFLTYMQENVFEPLGMHHTVADYTDSIIPHRTSFYERRQDGRVLNAPYVDNSYKWAGGGFLSTPEDLVRFGMAHLGEELLNKETIEMLWTTQRTADGRATNYGIGWTTNSFNGIRQVMHGGGSVGGITMLLVWPDQKAAVAMVGNSSQAPMGWAHAVMIMQPFLEPEVIASDGSGPDIAGRYSCSVLVRGEVAVRGTFDVRGSPDGYWGLSVWSNDTQDRIVYSASRADETLLVTADRNGRLTRTVVSPEGDSLNGRWISGGGSGELRCSR